MLQQVAGACVLRHGLNLLLWSLRHMLRVSIEITIALRSRVSSRTQAEWLRSLSSRCLHILLIMLLCLHLLHQSLVLVDFLLDLVLLLLVIVGSLYKHHDAVIVGLGVTLFARHGL